MKPSVLVRSDSREFTRSGEVRHFCVARPARGPAARGSRADASIGFSGVVDPFCHLSQMNMYRSVPKVPDFPAMEREMLRFWKEHRIFEKLRAQTAGGPRWSFLEIGRASCRERA